MSEHRKETRQRVFLKGRIVFNNGSSSFDCLVRDMSSSGARLVMSDATTLPEAFDLYIPQKDRTYRATLRWRPSRNRQRCTTHGRSARRWRSCRPTSRKSSGSSISKG